ncbi:transcription factor [Haloarcula mannanilytica]|uniref:Transcription factor n=1 Tax=Haloarcula mannanilytica TaxID=2509225 RepID=A0A4C2EPJ6_9EURY|nr:transcription factor [Haloarcula mannanilytica]GCF16245.1 transcription factor [Haloarcula mannanilytica]
MNVVSTMGSGDLGRELNLDSVIDSLKNEFDIESNWHRDSMVTVRLEPDGPALTLYRTGTYQIRGTDSRDSLLDANKALLSALERIGVEFTEPSFEQKNAVYLEDFDRTIQLEALAVHLGLENVEYEPEQFPGVIYRPPELGTVNLVFSSGKTIISGTIHEDVAERSVEELSQRLSTLPT